MEKIIRDLKRVRLSLKDKPYNEPYNETDIEMEDNISTLNEVIESLSIDFDLIETIKGEIETIKGEIENSDLYHSNFILDSIKALIEQAEVREVNKE